MKPLVEVQNLKKYFKTASGGYVHAVDDITMSINKGETMGIVGESGCGKSTLGRTVIHLQPSTGGSIIFDDQDITNPTVKEMKQLRSKMQIIFQDPFSSLNPRMTVEETIKEPLILAKRLRREELEHETERLMDMVGIARRYRTSYPHELDGGRRQRIGIARCLSLNPQFIVCDEPVSALDVSIQAQILNLLMDIQEEHGLTYLFITHNMSVVRHISDHICVMYLGQIVETSPTKELFTSPLHPYTKALLSAIPTTDILHPKERIMLKGEITSPIDPKPGCRFAARCEYACEACQQPQRLDELLPKHYVACCRAGELSHLQ